MNKLSKQDRSITIIYLVEKDGLIPSYSHALLPQIANGPLLFQIGCMSFIKIEINILQDIRIYRYDWGMKRAYLLEDISKIFGIVV